MTDGTATGMITAGQLKAELDRKRAADREQFARLDAATTGRGAQTVRAADAAEHALNSLTPATTLCTSKSGGQQAAHLFSVRTAAGRCTQHRASRCDPS